MILEIYECEPCCYKTDRSHNLTIHKNSKKHLRRILEQKAEDESGNSKSESEKVPSKMNGKNEKFEHNINKITIKLMQEISKLRKENDNLKQELFKFKQDVKDVPNNDGLSELLKQIPQKKKYIPKTLKQAVWNKHIGNQHGEGLCKCCKLRIISQMNFHCGHIIAESKNGETNINNLLPICAICNNSIYNKHLNYVQKMFEEKIPKVKQNKHKSNNRPSAKINKNAKNKSICECDNCGTVFQQRQSLWRHKKYRCVG